MMLKRLLVTMGIAPQYPWQVSVHIRIGMDMASDAWMFKTYEEAVDWAETYVQNIVANYSGSITQMINNGVEIMRQPDGEIQVRYFDGSRFGMAWITVEKSPLWV